MRLIYASVKNYRIHQGDTPVTVTFQPNLTLITGENETGKSSFIQAIHDCLFVKARGESAIHRLMCCSTDIRPEVKVVFESSGVEYTVSKHFRGANGTCELKKDILGQSPQIFSGNDAEAELLRALGLDSRGSEPTPAHWQLCWVHQGVSGLNPAKQINAEARNTLDSILKEQTGRVISTGHEQIVLRCVLENFTELMTEDGKPRVPSALGQALKSFGEAEKMLAGILDKSNRMQLDLTDLETLNRTVKECESSIPEKEKAVFENQLKLQTARELEAELKELESAVKLRDYENNTLEEKYKRGLTLQSEMESQTLGLKKISADSIAAQQEYETWINRASEKEAETQKCREREAALYQEVQFLKQRQELSQVSVQVQSLRGTLQNVTSENDALKKAQAECGEIKITAKAFEKIKDLKAEVERVSMSIQVSAVRVKVTTKLKTTVMMGRVPADASKAPEYVLTQPATIHIGDDQAVIEVIPGAGELSRLKQELTEKENELRMALGKAGEVTFESAMVNDARKRDLEGEIRQLQFKVGLLAPEGVDACRSAYEVAHTKEAQLIRALENFAPSTVGAEVSIEQLEEQLSVARQAAECARNEHTTATASCQVQQNLLSSFRQSIQERKQRLAANEAQWALVKVGIKDWNKVSEILEDRKRVALLLRNDFNAKKRESEGLDCASLEKICAVSRTTLEGLKADKESKSRDRSELVGRLSTYEGTGLNEEVGDAGAKVEHLRSQVAREKKHTDALCLLKNTLVDAQRESAQSLLAPLRETIKPLLEILFPKADMHFEIGEKGGISLQPLTRSGRVDDFSTLSGGTAEQVGVVVRLGIAQVLATRYGGTLPVILDDALVSSDSGRHKQMMAVLRQASHKLQLIILTCGHQDYHCLGVPEDHVLHLKRPLPKKLRAIIN